MIKLKFETENATHGLSQTRGFAWYNDKGLLFEYQQMDSILEVLKKDSADAFVPFTDIQEITYEKSWLSGDSVLIELSSMKNVVDIPFIQETSLVLELDKKQRETGKNFVVDAQVAMANYRIKQLEK
jgi:hypothetical protein